jgi:trk system potassium uptake protein
MKFCVIGLGRFGHQVAQGLAENGMEVLAVDSNESIVASIKDSVTQALCMRVIDEASLRSIGVDEMDTVIVAMGENFAQSILITALLKKRMNIPNVIARAINDIHKEILTIVGADRVILPEQEIGIKLADRLSLPFTDLMRLTKDFSISSLKKAPAAFLGKTIETLDLYNQYAVYCIGIKEDDSIKIIPPDHVVQQGNKLIFAGHNRDLELINKLP